MKQILRIICVCVIVFIISCGKDKEETPTPNNTPTQASYNYIKAKINDNLWQSSSIMTDYDDTLFHEIALMGLNSSPFVVFGITLPDTCHTGTFNLSRYGNYIIQCNFSSSDFYMSDTGIIVISLFDTINRNIEGSFEFSGANWQETEIGEITEGEFKIHY